MNGKSMSILKMESQKIDLSINQDDPGKSIELRHKSSGSVICQAATQMLLVRHTDAVSEPAVLKKIVKISENGNILQLYFQDETGEYKARLVYNSSSTGLTADLEIVAPRPVWLVEWRLSGCEFDDVIIPALGGQVISKTMPVGKTLSYKYPFWLSAQFVIGSKSNEHTMIRSADKSTSMKLVRVGKDRTGFSITYGFEVQAQKMSSVFKASWMIESFSGDWQTAVDHYRTWMESGFTQTPYHEHNSYPEWANDINFVLEIWGARRDDDQPFHTFDQMIERIEAWQKIHPPKNTLLYLPGFAEKGIDSHAPDYYPSEQCGGSGAFGRLIKRAHALGYRVMIHTNTLAMTYTHRLYEKFKKYQVVDVFGRPQGWGLDMDGDWLAEPYFAYMNPGYPEWTEVFGGMIGKLIGQYDLDAVFLDQTLLAFNIKEGPDFIAGMREHVGRMQKMFPNILFAGEGLHEQNISCLPMAQIHGLDSIKEVHAMDDEAPWRNYHPVSVYLFGKYTKFVPHLLTKHPSAEEFNFQEKAYTDLNVLPALVLYNSEQAIDPPELEKMLDRAKKLNT